MKTGKLLIAFAKASSFTLILKGSISLRTDLANSISPAAIRFTSCCSLFAFRERMLSRRCRRASSRFWNWSIEGRVDDAKMSMSLFYLFRIFVFTTLFEKAYSSFPIYHNKQCHIS